MYHRRVPTAQAVANAIIRMAKAEGRTLTNMQVQKHVFLAHGYCLAILDRPLYSQDTHAWQWGPVVPKLYKALQKYGSGNVTDEIQAEDVLDEDTPEYKILKGVWAVYKSYSGMRLSELTHRENTPWSRTWNEKHFDIIPLNVIRDYYTELVAARK